VKRIEMNGADNPIRHQGQYFDGETELSYNHHRYFDPEIGSFVSADPCGLIGGINPYEYAVNFIGWADPLGLACGPAVRQNSRGRWIDARGKFAHAPNVSSLPPLKGKSVGHVEAILQSRGYTRTNPANPRNQRWVHPDGSEVQIHAYGNVATGPYKAGNNAHAHKSLGRHGNAGTTELADDGMTAVSTHSSEAHIGLKNPADYPTVAGRPHGT
jgi:RHS repeat-associated protein